MSRDIPFFEMFTELQLSGELRLRLAGAVVNGACIDQAGMSLALRLTTRAELGDAELEELKHLLMGVYGFRQVTTEVTCKAPSSQAAAAGSRPAASVPAAPSGSKGEKQAAGKVLMGKPIRIQPVPMKMPGPEDGECHRGGEGVRLRVPGDPAARYVAAELRHDGLYQLRHRSEEPDGEGGSGTGERHQARHVAVRPGQDGAHLGREGHPAEPLPHPAGGAH